MNEDVNLQKRKTACPAAQPSDRRKETGKDLLLGELILAYAAQGAHPISGNLLPGGAGGNAVVGITLSGIVDIAAQITNILIHYDNAPYFIIKVKRHRPDRGNDLAEFPAMWYDTLVTLLFITHRGTL